MATETKMYVDDIGTIWRVDVVEAIGTPEEYGFYVQKPDGTDVTWNNLGTGDNGANLTAISDDGHTLTYTIQAGDYDQSGTYKAHAFIKYSTGDQWTGELFSFKVYAKWK